MPLSGSLATRDSNLDHRTKGADQAPLEGEGATGIVGRLEGLLTEQRLARSVAARLSLPAWAAGGCAIGAF